VCTSGPVLGADHLIIGKVDFDRIAALLTRR
jgi:hypothetical protein